MLEEPENIGRVCFGYHGSGEGGECVMLCLVADNEREVEAEPIGRIIAARLRAAMRAKGWTQGQVHYQVNRGLPQGQELLSLKTVGQLLRGSQVNPSFGTVLAVAQALGLTPDQVAGVTPMPETAPLPLEDDVSARVRNLESELREMRQGFAQFLRGEADADRQAATAIEQSRQSESPVRGVQSPPDRNQKAK